MKFNVKKFLKKILRKIFKKRNYKMGNLVSGREVSPGGAFDSMPQGVMGMETGMGGDQISGQWTNPYTGQTVFARQMIDNGGEALIVTDQGVIPMSEFGQFVKMDENQPMVTSTPPPTQNIQTNLGGLQMSDEDTKLLAGLNNPKPVKQPSLDKPLNQQSTKQHSKIEVETKSPNYDIIDKLFKKFGTDININVSIDWNEFPKDKLETLTDIFDVPKKEIAEYLIENFLNKENIMNKIIIKI